LKYQQNIQKFLIFPPCLANSGWLSEGELAIDPDFVLHGQKLKRREELDEKVRILMKGWGMLNY